MAKKAEHVNKSYSISAADMIRVALVVLIVPQEVLCFHLPPPSFFRTGAATSPSCRSIASVNENNIPWCLQASAEGSEAEVGASKTAQAAATTAATAPPLSLPMLLEECPLRISDPDVRETDDSYTLTFNLPSEVTEDGLDLSVRYCLQSYMSAFDFGLILLLVPCWQLVGLRFPLTLRLGYAILPHGYRHSHTAVRT